MLTFWIGLIFEQRLIYFYKMKNKVNNVAITFEICIL